MRSSGGAAILLGAAVGVTAALIGRGNTPTPTPSASARLRSAVTNASNSPSSPSPSPSPTASPGTTPIAVVPGPVVVVPTLDSSAPSVLPAFPIATPRSALTSTAELERAEIRCYESEPEDCGLAAAVYAAGVLVPRDAARAERLRKVELTRLKRRCEQRSPHACLVLASRSHTGDGVPKDERRATALLEHARELCRKGSSSECAGEEPK